ncbi:mechanosensitive ion channel family protein [Desulfogranum mediterraneum]|uniref:mechanosensitive ion channel family protein n=1 Tax=Desulfogranum mediterraneum TaxID=160661 RepID=UPI001377D16D|nr:mechanosensitive ion channel domain-containing protein [Desulfogranum mediterraneum]
MLLFSVISLNGPCLAEETSSEVEASLSAAATPAERDGILARLSDQQIRELLIAELSTAAAAETAEPAIRTGLNARLHQWLHVIDSREGQLEVGAVSLLGRLDDVPADLSRVLGSIGGGNLERTAINLALMVLMLVLSFGVELFFRRLVARTILQLPQVGGEGDGGMSRLWGALAALLPSVVQITVFAFSAVILFFLVDVESLPIRLTFMALLGTVIAGRTLSLLSQLFCAPRQPGLRLFPLDDGLARALDQGIRFFVWYIAATMMFITLYRELGGAKVSIQAMGAMLGSLLLALIALKMIAKRKVVQAALLREKEGETISWAKQQLASMWHVLAVLYLFGIWLIWMSTLVTGSGKDNGALLISLLVVPLYLILDQIGRWIIGNIITTLGIQRAEEDEEQQKAALGENYQSPEEKARRADQLLTRVFRGFIALVLVLWVLALWGFQFPFALNIVNAAFDIIVTLALALLIWRLVARYIEGKLAESMPEEEEGAADDGGEFGSARQLGRSYTLLPMIRKFIAITMLVMVALIVLSSIGVDIGPLLAGAGVVGLAVGFGAQKLVSDILSGVFYLLDDAFRVGEYIQAGSIKGAVEGITLRNVMLRHHRGMLQIVPHSELGTITNFMRGGIVVKFNLEFPYDTNVDLVRRIIKKVGQAMLQDEELGPDFILPVKSQGVSEITNSVMVIRVKFTAHPGRQFLIRREAYRRITEALAAKNIHYAHRKVIVEVPSVSEQALSPGQRQSIAEAGAAAAQALQGPGSQEGGQTQPA